MPRSRGRALVALCTALARGDIVLDRGADRGDARRALLGIPGVGPWTADYIALRALGDPDVFLPTDAMKQCWSAFQADLRAYEAAIDPAERKYRVVPSEVPSSVHA